MLRTILLLLAFTTGTALAFSEKGIVANCKDKAKGPCYEFPGRARMYSNKWIRIWKKGSNRMYQISTQTKSAFSDLKHLNMATEVHAMFDVCFLRPEVPSGFSDICVQSIKGARTSYVPE